MFAAEAFAAMSFATTAFGPAPPAVVIADILLRPDGASQYLVEIEAYSGGEARSGGQATFSEIAFSDAPIGSGVDVGLVTLRYADSDWIGRPTDADKPNVYYEGRVSVPLVLERAMPLEPEIERRVQRQYGFLEIANGDGALDSIVKNYAVDARAVTVRFGARGAAYNEFGVIAAALAMGWDGDDLAIRLGLRDRAYQLDTPLQSNLYAGSGGAEGTAEIAGKPKPIAYGPCRNVTAVLIDPGNKIYQVSDGPILAVDAVYERGAEITASGSDYADYAALAASGVAAGNFATSLAAGMFKLGSSPSGLITADIRGDATGGYVDTIDQVALRILQGRAGLSASEIAFSSFSGLASVSGPMALFVAHNETPSTSQVMSALAGSVGGWWGAGRDGRIGAGKLTPPEAASPTLYLTQYEILSLKPEAKPLPRYRQRVAWQRNWTQQRGEDLAGSVTAARRQFLTETDRVVTAADASVLNRHPQAFDAPVLPGLFDAAADGQQIADDLLALFGPDRAIYSVAVKRLGYTTELQTTTRIVWPRYGLGNGQNFAVIGIREDADRDETILRLWG